MKNKRIGILCLVAVLFLLLTIWVSIYFFAPTRILIVNPLPAQAADISLNNDSRFIAVECVSTEEAVSFRKYDAVLFFGRSLNLTDEQMKKVEKSARKGTKFYTISLRNFNFIVNRNITEEENTKLSTYLNNPIRRNYRNALRYIRAIATPYKFPVEAYDEPFVLPSDLYYHLEYGNYFQNKESLIAHLKEKKMYHPQGKNIAFISGVSMPMEGNRAHVDTLISRITQKGFNVFPLFTSSKRGEMLRDLNPDGVVYIPMGRIGDDSLVKWLHDNNIPVFSPFPLIEASDEWLDPLKPVSGGTLTARILVPEIDGSMAPLLIATQNKHENGYYLYTPEEERVSNFVNHFCKYMALRDRPNKDKRIAVCYFKSPGRDALLASGMEVIPSLYNFLMRLQAEGYDLSGLPTSVAEFEQRIQRDGVVLGSYAPGAQEAFLANANPLWLTRDQYETWARKIVPPEKYKEVLDRYGDAPGDLLIDKDSAGEKRLAIACVQFGNVLLFPQPRPALGDDDFKLLHGVPVAPPHSYLAPYLYVQEGFKAHAIIHFGTHGNLEFTPGKNVALSKSDWADMLVGDLPHFYFYTTGNVGEGIIAKRRTHAVLLTHLTPPYIENGRRKQYTRLLDDIHLLLAGNDEENRDLSLRVKAEVIRLGLHRDLELDSILTLPYTSDELEKIDLFMEEIANEKTLGAFYTLGEPYAERDLLQTAMAISVDQLAYDLALADRDSGIITTTQLHDFSFVTHAYLPKAKKILLPLLESSHPDTASLLPAMKEALNYKKLLMRSTQDELSAIVRGLNGGTIYPAPGGDPVLNPNVLPTGRNMYSINAEMTPGIRSWEEGQRLAENTLKLYKEKHGDYPRKVSYTLWAGEFITTEGATIAQALWMLGVEPVRDGQNRVVDLRLIPSEELGRPRINIVIQVSGQLRDIAGSRLKLLTDAIRLASSAENDSYPNYVASGTLLQEKMLVENGMTPKKARLMSVMRIFGPVNSGYSTGMLAYTENSGKWNQASELVDGYLNNMGAIYGNDENWGDMEKGLFASAIMETDVVIQPRQSNTWGPLSLDHVYEFTGGMSLAVKTLTGKEPDAYMADYRNRNNKRLQPLKEAVAVEARATILNPVFIRERMKGGASTAQAFGEVFRNIFGWNVMRPSALDKEFYNELYRTYILDEHQLELRSYFDQINPAAYQAITSVLLESARKGYWKASDEQLRITAHIHAENIEKNGAACSEFVCDNENLQTYISTRLTTQQANNYNRHMEMVKKADSRSREGVVLKRESTDTTTVFREESKEEKKREMVGILISVFLLLCLLFFICYRRKKV